MLQLWTKVQQTQSEGVQNNYLNSEMLVKKTKDVSSLFTNGSPIGYQTAACSEDRLAEPTYSSRTPLNCCWYFFPQGIQASPSLSLAPRAHSVVTVGIHLVQCGHLLSTLILAEAQNCYRSTAHPPPHTYTRVESVTVSTLSAVSQFNHYAILPPNNTAA